MFFFKVHFYVSALNNNVVSFCLDIHILKDLYSTFKQTNVQVKIFSKIMLLCLDPHQWINQQEPEEVRRMSIESDDVIIFYSAATL